MKPSERFSDRVENYVKFRPSYPIELVELLASEVDDADKKTCADIGSGTGILTKLLLSQFKKVFAVEPNLEMRSYAEKTLAQYPNFFSMNSDAEKTMLPSDSIDLVTVAQAFHWFDRQKFLLECRRILKPTGYVAIVWNKRLTNTPFLNIYETLIRTYSTDYNEVNHQKITAEHLAEFYLGGYRKVVFPNSQQFNLFGVYGRLDSSSFAPKQDKPEFDILRRELKKAFDEFSKAGTISFNYETELYLGKVI
jgi:ubiquinone/menaquinone biosynthesis C-methylase UbiE